MRGADPAAWELASRRARELAGDSVLLVGHEIRFGAPPALPTDTASLLLGAAELAQLAGRPLHYITDGETDLDAAALQRSLPRGSRIVAESVPRRPDLAITAVVIPAAAVAGDTLELRATVAAAEAVPPRASLVASVDGRYVGGRALEPFAAWESRGEHLAIVLPPGPPSARVAVVLDAPGDGEPRNDTASRMLRRGERLTAVAVSTSPDFDFREIVRVLRGSLSLPTSARFRIAPGRWVDDAGRPISEPQVRAEVARAQVVLLHGDTAFFGAPRMALAGAVALVPPPDDDSEWYVSGAPPSPIAHILGSLEFDSLPPIAVGAGGTGVPLLEVRGPGQRIRHAGALDDSVRRVITLPLRGTARWALRGGVPADAFATLWGSVFAALAERPGVDFPIEPPIVALRELHPRPPVLRSGSVGDAVPAAVRAPIRSSPWPYLMIVALLCTEWVLRRRRGLR